MCEGYAAHICNRCNLQWSKPPHLLRFDDVPTSSVVPYSNQVSSVVLKAKEDGNRVARRLIAETMYRSIDLIMEKSPQLPLLMVPIPSSRRAIRERGESFLHPIMKNIIDIAHSNSRDWTWKEILIHKKRVRDQAGLDSRERTLNVRGVFTVRNGVFVDRPIIVVDDVITTGATLRNAISALNERKMTVLGASTACASAHQFLIR
ncbi:MAG: ComF family protein [Actinomycetota bacterium]